MKIIEYTNDGEVIYESVEEEAAGSAPIDLDMPEPTGEDFFFDGIIEEYDAPDRAADTPGFISRDFKLGSTSYPEFKADVKKHCWRTRWGKVCANRPYVWTKTSNITLYIRVAVRNVTADDVWQKIKGCAMGAAGAAGVASIFAAYTTGGAAVLPAFTATFKTAFTACLVSQGGELASLARDTRVNAYTNKQTGDWS